MPLFGLIKNKKKKTKDRQPEDNNTGSVASTTSTTPTTPTAQATAGGALSNSNNNNSNNTLPAVTKTSSSSSSKDKKINKTKSDQPSLTPVRTISHKTPNPFTATPAINVPKSPTLGTSSPSEIDDSNRMYSSSPFSSSPQPPQPQVPQPQQQQLLSPNQPHLQNVVTGQYNAPPTPPSTARSGSIDDKIDALPSIGASSQPYQHDHLKHPQPQQSYPQYPQQQPSEAMIGSSSGLLTPVPSANERVIPSRFPSAQQNTLRATKGKYAIVDFSIQRTLGTGSFGRVHLVQSRHNSRFYAIKVLKKQQVVKMKQVEHTNDERAMLQVVKHPFLVNLWGTFQDSKNLYMVMDFIEGGELFSLLRKSQRFPNPVAKFYAAEVALAINYLHSLDIIYRDLKPENLLLDRHGHVKITDFGFAKKVPDITWTLCGTPDYLAPEVVASKGYNKSVDWWSLGILTFEMLAGYPPFYDQNPMKLYENIMNGRVKYPSYFDATAKDLLGKLLTADLSKRYGNLKAGSADVFNHPWFVEVNWERLERREIDAPYIPPIRPGGGDASQFERYDEEGEEYGDFTSKDPYGHLFQDF